VLNQRKTKPLRGGWTAGLAPICARRFRAPYGRDEQLPHDQTNS
jgi:hypothetical protein